MTDQRMTSATWGLLLGLALIWGGSFLAVRIALDEIGALSVVAHRVLWASVALWIVVLVRRIPVRRDAAIWGAFLVMGLVNNALPFTLLAWGQLHIETGLTAILNASTAIWGVLVAAAIFADERLSRRRLLGVGLGFLGVATAIGLKNLASFDLRSAAQLSVVGAAISYAVAGSWARARLKGVPPLLAAAGMLTSAALVMVPLAWIVEGPLPVDLSPATFGAVAYIALASTAFAYLLYYAILARTGAGNLLLVTLLVAPVAILLGALVRHEALGPAAYAGFALLALGLLVLDGRIGHVPAKIRAALIDAGTPRA